MNTVHAIFLNELEKLNTLIKFYNREERLLENYDFRSSSKEVKFLLDLSDSLRGFHISKRQFNYNSIIISLYGAFERFIENVILTYIESINQIVKEYNNLAEEIKNNHLNLSLLLLSKADHQKYSGVLKKEDIVKNLHSCVNVNNNYTLNKEAFVMHTANFRTQVIDESFRRLNVQNLNKKILNTSSFKQYVIDKEAPNYIIEPLNEEVEFSLINDLTERRNEVAHGLTNEIIKNEILLEYIELFEKYSYGLIEALEKELLNIEINETNVQLGKITDVFEEGHIVCFETNHIPLKVGSIIVSKTFQNITKGEIISMQLKDVDINEVDDKESYEVGVKINEKFSKNSSLFLLNY